MHCYTERALPVLMCGCTPPKELAPKLHTWKTSSVACAAAKARERSKRACTYSAAEKEERRPRKGKLLYITRPAYTNKSLYDLNLKSTEQRQRHPACSRK